MTLKDKTSNRPFNITLVINLVATKNDSPTNFILFIVLKIRKLNW